MTPDPGSCAVLRELAVGYTSQWPPRVLCGSGTTPEDMSQGGDGTRSLRLWPNSVFNVFFHLLVPVWLTLLASWVAPKGQRGALEKVEAVRLPV